VKKIFKASSDGRYWVSTLRSDTVFQSFGDTCCLHLQDDLIVSSGCWTNAVGSVSYIGKFEGVWPVTVMGGGGGGGQCVF
jgi:hypothetical protein